MTIEEMDEYMRRPDFITKGDDDSLWIEGAAGYPGPAGYEPTDRLILCDAPALLLADNPLMAEFVMERIKLALGATSGFTIAELRRMAQNEGREP